MSNESRRNFQDPINGTVAHSSGKKSKLFEKLNDEFKANKIKEEAELEGHAVTLYGQIVEILDTVDGKNGSYIYDWEPVIENPGQFYNKTALQEVVFQKLRNDSYVVNMQYSNDQNHGTTVKIRWDKA